MYLLMKPVCPNCGSTINKFAIIGNSTLSMIPNHCVMCGAVIDGVSYQEPIDGVFDYDECNYISEDIK